MDAERVFGKSLEGGRLTAGEFLGQMRTAKEWHIVHNTFLPSEIKLYVMECEIATHYLGPDLVAMSSSELADFLGAFNELVDVPEGIVRTFTSIGKTVADDSQRD